MVPAIKILKVGLPLATAASASVITTSLVSTRREDIKFNNKNEDRIIEDFEKPLEIYEEEIINYPQDGKKEEGEISENNKKLEEVVREELGKKDRQELVKRLLTDPDSIVDELLKSKNISAPREAIKKMLSDVVMQQHLRVKGQEVQKAHPKQSLEDRVDKGDVQQNFLSSQGEVVNENKEAQASEELSHESFKKDDQILQSPINEELVPIEEDKESSQPEKGTDIESREETSLTTQEKLNEVDTIQEGHRNGLEGEQGKDPMTAEHLKRMAEIATEASSMLNSLESLLKKNH